MESLRGRRFRVASPSFFQVNIRQLDRLVDLVKEELELSGSELVVDAYAGVGTFALLLAPYAGRVIAIEESPAAVEDALANADDAPRVEFIQGRTEQVLSELEERPQGLILDPPRKGCHPSALGGPETIEASADGVRVVRPCHPCQGPKVPLSRYLPPGEGSTR